jgi:hypothetical protein
MIRNALNIMLFFFCGSSLIAQKVPDQSPLPGNTKAYITFNTDSYLDVNTTGKQSIWDYAYLQAPYQNEIIISAAGKGTRFNSILDADYVIRGVNNQIVYYKKSNKDILELGRKGGFWLMEDLDKTIDYDTNPIIKKGGLKFGESYVDRSNFNLHLRIDEVSAAVKGNLPLISDSIRYEVTVERTVTADGVGQLILPHSIYDAIRVKSEIHLSIKAYIKESLGWKEWNGSILSSSNPSSIPQGEFDMTQYEFWSEDQELPVLSIERQNSGDYVVNYLAVNSNIPKVKVEGQKKDVLAHPNPTYGEIEFQLVSLPPGVYELKVYNIVGKPIHSSSHRVGQSRKIRTDLSFLSKGTYLYSILDPQGNKITTKRVMIITP